MKSKFVRLGISLALALGGLTVVSTPASAVVCDVHGHVNTYAIYVKVITYTCASQIRPRLYYFLAPNGPTMYSTTGPWVWNNAWSTASTSSTRYFAGYTVQVA